MPEWYFLPFYAILRAFTIDILGVSAKLQGVIFMFASIGVLFILPWLDRSAVRSGRFRSIWFKLAFWALFVDCFILGVVGANSPDDIWFLGFKYVTIGQLGTFWYFFHFIVILPVLAAVETPKPLPNSISEAVLGGGAAGAEATSKPMEKA